LQSVAEESGHQQLVDRDQPKQSLFRRTYDSEGEEAESSDLSEDDDGNEGAATN